MSPWPAPLLLLFGPLVVGGVLLAGGRRWPRATGWAGVAGALLLWGLLTAVSPATGEGGLFAGLEWSLLGRSFTLTAELRDLFRLFYTATGLLCLGAAIRPQGGRFVPLSLLVWSPLAAVLLARPFTFGAVALLVAAALLAVIIQGEQAQTSRAAVRFLGLMTAVVPLFLVADWLIAVERLAYLGPINRLLLVALVITLAGFPAHIWVRPMLTSGPPLAAPLVMALFPAVALLFSRQLLAASAAMPEPPPFLPGLQLSGAALLLLAGFRAATTGWTGSTDGDTAGPARLLADWLLIDVGALLVVLGSGETFDAAAGLGLLALRFAGLGLAVLGLSLAAGGAGRRAGRALWAYGGLSLLGLPLTPGFGGRWTAVLLAGASAPWLAAVMLLAMTGGLIGLWRAWGKGAEERI